MACHSSDGSGQCRHLQKSGQYVCDAREKKTYESLIIWFCRHHSAACHAHYYVWCMQTSMQLCLCVLTLCVFFCLFARVHALCFYALWNACRVSDMMHALVYAAKSSSSILRGWRWDTLGDVTSAYLSTFICVCVWRMCQQRTAFLLRCFFIWCILICE